MKVSDYPSIAGSGNTKKLSILELTRFIEWYCRPKHSFQKGVSIVAVFIHQVLNLDIIKFDDGSEYVFQDLKFGFSGGDHGLGPDTLAEILKIAGASNVDVIYAPTDKTTLVWTKESDKIELY